MSNNTLTGIYAHIEERYLDARELAVQMRYHAQKIKIMIKKDKHIDSAKKTKKFIEACGHMGRAEEYIKHWANKIVENRLRSKLNPRRTS